ncbi:MAG: Tex family protein [Desulfobacterales bacterium]|jgi:uncharacterized protein
MDSAHAHIIADELSIRPEQVQAAAALLDEGATIPFISRYRKEATGSLDEVAVTAVRDRLGQLRELDTRRKAILASLEKNGHLTEELQQRVHEAQTLAELEDLYLPYRPKRRTRATMAREKGLEPLAGALFAQDGINPWTGAAAFIDPEKNVDTADEALAGARDIIAEWVSEDAEARAELRRLFTEKGVITSRVVPGKETEGSKYRDYFDWSEPMADAPSHRILAMRRGEREDVLTLSIAPPESDALAMLQGRFVTGSGADAQQVGDAVVDAYRRLIARSMETEMRLATKDRADADAIRVFAGNLRELLLSPPLGQRRVMGIDPGFRTGCKLVCLDRQGKLLHHETVYLHRSESQDRQAAARISELCTRFDIEAVAVGSGTAGRETEALLKSAGIAESIPVMLVNESGASVYSASQTAREEFPDLDLTVRGAVSIGRRLMDPLAELVKIDPKSIGVGQYQHDVDPPALRSALDDVVVSCVNAVGVEVNSASAQLLTYVSGLGPQLARNIVAFRDANGPFNDRRVLLKVPRLGPKAFEQSAGFLRIRGGENPLDASAVHPERYPVVAAMANDLNATVPELMADAELRKKIDPSRYVGKDIGLPTLRDILQELSKPGRDPRREFETITFAAGIERIEDLTPGMRIPGVVTNVTAFGAFVDVGVHQDGLVHVSQLADRFVRDPSRVVRVHQRVTVTVLSVDLERRRISLSMKKNPEAAPRRTPPEAARPRKKIGAEKRKNTGKPGKAAPFHNPFAELLRKNKANP